MQPFAPLLAVIAATLVCSASPPSPARAAGSEEQDPRLQKTIRLDLEQVPVSDLCRVLERRTGIRHRPADLRTADLLATVVGEFKVGELQQALGDALNVQWTHTGPADQAVYVVERTPASIAEEERAQKEREREIAANLKHLLELVELPDEKIAELPRAWSARLQQHGTREMARVLGQLPPGLQSAIAGGLPVTVPLASLLPASRASVQAMSAAGLQAPIPAGFRRPQVNLGDGGDWKLTVAPGGLEMSGLYTLDIRLTATGKGGQYLLLNLPVHEAFGADDDASHRLPRTPDAAPAGNAFNPPELPLSARWEAMTHELARASGHGVVSDAYRLQRGVDPLRLQFFRGGGLDAYLNHASRYWRRRWGRVGSALTFQRIEWPLLRGKQIPESQLRHWRSELVETGHVTFDDLLQMVRLRPSQQAELTDALGPEIARSVGEHRDLLLLWNGLSPGLREQGKGAGFLARDLPLASQPHAFALLREALQSSAALVVGRARLQVNDAGKQASYVVRHPDRDPVERPIELTTWATKLDQIRREEKAREAALQAALKG